MSYNLDIRQSRTALLLGTEKLDKLRNSHVLIMGLGGVGGYAAEQLCRAGIGELTLADADVVNESNINRQIIALGSTIGKPKTDVLAQRLKDINPEIKLNLVTEFIKDELTAKLLDASQFDYVLDCIDTLAPKTFFIQEVMKRNIPMVSSMGAGGRLDPALVKLSDISKTYNDGLARMLRKRLHKIGIRTGFKAVFSPEPISGELIYEQSQNKNTNIGTISYMPAIFGLYMASAALRDLISDISADMLSANDLF